MERLGTGIGWRPEIADAVERMPGIDWVEAVAENVCPGHLPDSLRRLRERGITVVPHGVSLGLGGADRPDEGRLTALAERAEALGSPLVTEHIAFVRAGGALTATPHLEAGHLLPVPRTRDALEVLCENVRIAQEALPVPLAVENIAALISWPGEEMTEGQFLYELADRTGVRLLIDVANLHTNHVNRAEDPAKALAELPLEAIAYVHVAGGFERDGVWHDSHAHPAPRPVLDILTDLASRVSPPGVLLERDENFPEPAELEAELASIRRAVEAGAVERVKAEVRAAGHAVAARPRATPGGRSEARRPGAAPAGRSEVRAGTPARSDAATPRAVGTLTPDVPDAGSLDEQREPLVAAATPQGHETGAAGATRGATGRPEHRGADEARQRLGLAQAALLSALVAGTPVPEGFDRARVGVQARALAAKRADVVAKVAPELPEILGAEYRTAFLGYAQAQPMTGGYRRDALTFAEHLLSAGRPGDAAARRELREWWLERSGPAPRSRRPVHRLARATRKVLLRR
ncbi:multinuclear nonheme iron-dependent oxidase [Streptomyces coeruleorubidus]|uniref:multinuclear nonheme iron-dependent oxidase n=1 Tax=Streptomyces coeruleorubidus TaxID=116188 RepID=UPI0033F5D5AF